MNDCMYAENFGRVPKWLPGRVTRIYGPRSYEIQLQDGTLTRRHVDSIEADLEPTLRNQRVQTTMRVL